MLKATMHKYPAYFIKSYVFHWIRDYLFIKENIILQATSQVQVFLSHKCKTGNIHIERQNEKTGASGCGLMCIWQLRVILIILSTHTSIQFGVQIMRRKKCNYMYPIVTRQHEMVGTKASVPEGMLLSDEIDIVDDSKLHAMSIV